MTAHYQNLRSATSQHADTTENETIMIQPNTRQQRTKQAVRAAGIVIAIALCALSTSAQTDKDVKGATPLVVIQNEAPAKLIVDPPIPEQLALGRVFIQYRTENLRVLPVFGKAALDVSPRIGHLHYYLDDQSWPTVDTSGETVVFVGLAPGPHKVRVELADTIHRPIPGCSRIVEFAVPDPQQK
jgi:hypothetical protein